ncbi:MAG: hypothetical protein ACOCS7_02220 [Halolamina sp.]
MPSITRREALAALTAGVATLAGCTGSETSSRAEPTARSEPIDYRAERVRDESGAVLFSRADRTPRTRDGEPVRHGTEYLATRAELEDLEFGASDPANRLQSFTSETDFETGSVFLWAAGISECRDVRLQWVGLDPDGDPQVDFCRFVRPADVDCSVDAVETVAYAIRLPVDGASATGFGTGMSSSCDRPSRPPAFDATITAEEDGE